MKKNNKIKKITKTEKRFKRLFSKRYILGLVVLILLSGSAVLMADFIDAPNNMIWSDVDHVDVKGNLTVDKDFRVNGRNMIIAGADGTKDEPQTLLFVSWGKAVGGLFFKTFTQGSSLKKAFYISTGNDADSMGAYGSADLHVSGIVTAANYSCSSDKRYKKNIVALHDSLNKILSLQGVSYFWKNDKYKEKGFTDKKDIGFVAQDMEKVFPELVYTGEDGYKSVNYQKMSAVLVEAIKELHKENQGLKQKVASLEKMNEKIAALEKRLDRVGMVGVK